jgi:DNA-binding winged helix-turn-helix (wHTH) protein
VSEASTNLVYACDQWEIDLGRRELRSRGIPVPLGGRAFEVITVLVQSATEFVTKDHMMERVWPGAVVGEGTIHVHISAVRKALGPDRGLLKTASGRGYRLLGNWTPQHREGTAARVYSSACNLTLLRFCWTDSFSDRVFSSDGAMCRRDV